MKIKDSFLSLIKKIKCFIKICLKEANKKGSRTHSVIFHLFISAIIGPSTKRIGVSQESDHRLKNIL